MTEATDEFGPYFDAPTGPDDPLAPPHHPGAPGMRLDRYEYLSVPGPWWRFWRRHDTREVARYRPIQTAVLLGGPCDGTVYGTTARPRVIILPVFTGTARAAWGEFAPVSPAPLAEALYARTGEVTDDGRHVFRYSEPLDTITCTFTGSA